MTVPAIQVGQMIEDTVEWIDKLGAFVDPTVVIAKVRRSDGQVTSYTYGAFASPIVRLSQGRYRINVIADRAWCWAIRWDATGTFTGAVETSFEVEPSMFNSP